MTFHHYFKEIIGAIFDFVKIKSSIAQNFIIFAPKFIFID